MTQKEQTLRTALADYMRYAGCGCCGDRDKRVEAEKVLAGLLEVPMYEDGSGYQFYKFGSDTDLIAKLDGAHAD